MGYVKRLVFACIMIVAIFTISQSWALDPALEGEYQKARLLLREGKQEEVLNIFRKVANENQTDIIINLGTINAMIDEAMSLKANNDPGWKRKIHNAFGDLRIIYSKNRSSPEVYLSFAKCYWLNNSLLKAEKSLKKAFYYKPGYIEALTFSGDMYLEEGKKIGITVFQGEASRAEARDSMETYRGKAKTSYEKALAMVELDNETKAMVHYKLGEVYLVLYDYKDKAREQWDSAVSIAAESPWGKKAQERLSTLK